MIGNKTINQELSVTMINSRIVVIDTVEWNCLSDVICSITMLATAHAQIPSICSEDHEIRAQCLLCFVANFLTLANNRHFCVLILPLMIAMMTGIRISDVKYTAVQQH